MAWWDLESNAKGFSSEWIDHVDVRPTMLAVLDLNDSYLHDGRVIISAIQPSALPPALRNNALTLTLLGDVYKQINAPFGIFSLRAVDVSTSALVSGSDSDDSTYTSLESRIGALTTERDALALRMKTMLDGALNGQPVNVPQARLMIAQGASLLLRISALAHRSG